MWTRRRLLSDITPLRESRQYRLLYAGELLAFLGSQPKRLAHHQDHGIPDGDQVGPCGNAQASLTVVAVPLQVYLLTHSSLAVALRPLPPGAGAARAGIASVREGLRFLHGRRALQGTFLIDLNAMVFGMPRALFPAPAPCWAR